MFKLVVSDFDGTLIDSDDAIPVSTVSTIDEYRRKGNMFVVATGRVLESILEYTKDYFFIDYIVSLNGAYIYDANKEKVISKTKLTLKAIRAINKKYIGKNVLYYCTPDAWNLFLGDLKPQSYVDDLENKIDDLDGFLAENKNNIFKMEVHFKTRKEADNACKEINKMNVGVKGVVQIHTKMDYLVEIFSSKVSKYIGVKYLQELLNLKNEEIVIIGDSYNDLELMKSKYYGVAVKNACDEIKEKAKYITTSNNNKGVERFLRDECLK